MKLTPALSSSQRQQLECALGGLQRASATYEARLAIFSEATAERGVLEVRLSIARRNARLLPTIAATLDSICAEMSQLQEKCAAAQEDAESARLLAVTVIRDTGHLIHRTCAPLLEQFKSDLAAALHAFCLHPAAAAEAIPEHGTEFPALVRFLQRGQHLARTAGPAEIECLTFELSQTLQCMLDGGHIWQLRGAAGVAGDSAAARR